MSNLLQVAAVLSFGRAVTTVYFVWVTPEDKASVMRLLESLGFLRAATPNVLIRGHDEVRVKVLPKEMMLLLGPGPIVGTVGKLDGLSPAAVEGIIVYTHRPMKTRCARPIKPARISVCGRANALIEGLTVHSMLQVPAVALNSPAVGNFPFLSGSEFLKISSVVKAWLDTPWSGTYSAMSLKVTRKLGVMFDLWAVALGLGGERNGGHAARVAERAEYDTDAMPTLLQCDLD